ncbi:MAG: UbiA family prenyltransferase [Planctomycetota bacterium]|nr:MAG: UbiA family prenyltransferase [Planctomycetota bacterium]
MIKFSHSVFALPFALMATFLAARSAHRAGDAPRHYPSIMQLILIIACMVTARSVAMTFNRIIDADVDARNPRTNSRAIPTGIISKTQATIFLLAAAGAFILCCAGFWWLDGNLFPITLSLPVLGYLCLYSYTKRFTNWSHFVLGSAIALSPVAAWLAIHPASVGSPAVVLLFTVTLWIGGFDIIYACQDIQIDQAEKLFSLPSHIGPARALWIARLAHLGTIVLLVILMPLANLGWLYGIGVGMVAILLLIENALVRADDFSKINLAFFAVNGIISIVLGILAIIDCLLGLGSAVDLA